MRFRNLILAVIGLIMTVPTQAMAIETSAEEAIVIDFNTQTVLMEKNSQDPMPTSSMSKVMTAYMIFDALETGQLNLTDELLVSEKAWRKGGSKMFVEVGEKVSVEDLLKGLIIQSGNDAAIVLAEGLGGTESGFAAMMNDRLPDLGMTNSNFVNASGWPHPDHYSTAHDLAMLAFHLIEDFPNYYDLYSETEFTFNNITQSNRNPLLYRNIGADGIKTGHTEAAGYGLMASAVQDGRRIIAVLNGMDSKKERAAESTRVMRWAFAAFDNVEVATPGDIVGDARVWLGQSETVGLTVNDPVVVTVKNREKEKMQVKLEVQEPINAPVRQGEILGKMVVSVPDYPDKTYAVEAAETVEKLGLIGQVREKIKRMIFGAEGA
jgi:D-alanyl-D-alanine carboxypeptidase (penicillin-binding protein 5/6)